MGKLSMIGQMKKEAERDFTKFVKYVAELEEENRKNIGLVKYYKAQNKKLKDELKSKTELVRYYRKEKKRLTEEIGKLVINKA